MGISIVAINRMLEESIKEGRTHKDVLVKNGKTVLFSKTKGPKYVAKLNKTCECIGMYGGILDSTNIYQFKATRQMH